jgi:multidrug efflux system membrane fusion protein
VQVQQVQMASGDGSEVRFSAVVMPDTQVPLAFRVPGYVTSLHKVRGADGMVRDIGEGDRVTRGTVLARLRGTEYVDKVLQAGSQTEAAGVAVEKAKLDYDRATRLFNSGSLTKPEFDAAQAQFNATQAQLRGARALKSEASVALHDTSITAPMSGDIVKKAIDVGSFVGPGTLAFVVARTDRVKVIFGVPDVTVRTLRIGTPVNLTTEALPGRTFVAKVSRIAAAADPQTRNFEVEVAIPNSQHLLKPGMIASLQLAAPKPVAQPLPAVPLSAMVQSPNGAYGVFTIATGKGGSVARFHPVEVGEVHGTQIEITRGLSNGETIITTGASILKDGQQVEVLR